MHLARKFFYRLTNKVSEHDIVLDMAEFFLIDRNVKEHVLSTRSTFPFVRGQVGYVGFRREGIAYKREKRIIGETPLQPPQRHPLRHRRILSSSTWPLRFLAYVGASLFALDLLVAVLFGGLAFAPVRLAVRWFAAGVAVHLGWLVFSVGTLGIYLARVYKDTIGLPLYVADPKALDHPHPEAP